MENYVGHTHSRITYAEALAEFPDEYRGVVHEFATGDKEHWNRRFCVRFSPALALQLAIDPKLEHARHLLDECHHSFDEVADAAGLKVHRHTRPHLLRVDGLKVRLAEDTSKENFNA